MAVEKRRPGRPPKAGGPFVPMTIRVRPDLPKALRAKALEMGVDYGDWLRSVLAKASRTG